MSETYTKADLLRELAQAAHISRRCADVVLETLTQIAYREARQGFAVPGICRLDVVHRQARQVRNPQTSQTLVIAEHDALRVRPVKRAKNAIAPTPRALVQVIPDPQPPSPTPTTTTAARPAAPMPAALSRAPTAPADEGIFVSFRCQHCGQEIEAPVEMVGAPNECPSCGEPLLVPYTSEEGTIWHQSRTTSPEVLPPSPDAIAAMKGRTIRIELPDDL